jgi:hypothetical protein
MAAAKTRARGRLFGAMLALAAGSLGASTIRVPQDSPLISLAVAGARPGDVIEVDDGLYFEKNVLVDKALTIRSKNLFGAVVYGSREAGAAIFLVRAACLIEGFVLRSASAGIIQRDSPDVRWTGRDLALFDLERRIRRIFWASPIPRRSGPSACRLPTRSAFPRFPSPSRKSAPSAVCSPAAGPTSSSAGTRKRSHSWTGRSATTGLSISSPTVSSTTGTGGARRFSWAAIRGERRTDSSS